MPEAAAAWNVVLTLVVIAGFVTNILSWRRKPPIAEDLYRDFATRAELQQLRTEFLKTTGEMFAVMRSIRDEIAHTSDRFTAQVNRLDGILSRCPGPTHCQKEST